MMENNQDIVGEQGIRNDGGVLAVSEADKILEKLSQKVLERRLCLGRG